MRATEFLIEYNRQITAKNYGKKLYDRTINSKDRAWYNLYYKFPETKDLPPEKQVEHIIASLEQTDPTPNKEYMQWIIRTYINEPDFWVQDLFSQVKDYLIKFDKLKKKKQLEYPRSDINKYTSFADFMGVMDEYPDPFKQEQLVKGEYKTIYEDDNLKAFVPITQDAACYLGQGTRWCTSATRTKNYFSTYNEQAPLFIIIPKQPQYNGEKYQLHFVVTVDGDPVTSQDQYDELWYKRGEDYMIDNTDPDGQFKNEKDIGVSLKSLASRFGSSFSNAVAALEKYDPEVTYAVNTNFENAGIK